MQVPAPSAATLAVDEGRRPALGHDYAEQRTPGHGSDASMYCYGYDGGASTGGKHWAGRCKQSPPPRCPPSLPYLVQHQRPPYPAVLSQRQVRIVRHKLAVQRQGLRAVGAVGAGSRRAAKEQNRGPACRTATGRCAGGVTQQTRRWCSTHETHVAARLRQEQSDAVVRYRPAPQPCTVQGHGLRAVAWVGVGLWVGMDRRIAKRNRPFIGGLRGIVHGASRSKELPTAPQERTAKHATLCCTLAQRPTTPRPPDTRWTPAGAASAPSRPNTPFHLRTSTRRLPQLH